MGKYWYRHQTNARSESKTTAPKVCPAWVHLVISDLRLYSPGQHSPVHPRVFVVPIGVDQHHLVPLKKEVHARQRQRTQYLLCLHHWNGRNVFSNIDFFPFIHIYSSACWSLQGWKRELSQLVVAIEINVVREYCLPPSYLTSACSWTECYLQLT